MMFAAGEEPIGVHVLTYQSSCAIKKIVNALEDEEVGVIRFQEDSQNTLCQDR